MGATFELEQDTYEYTGQEIKPKMKPIMDGDYALRENIDYELVIDAEDQNGVLLKAIEPGYYPLAVRGIGAYTGAYYGLYLHITFSYNGFVAPEYSSDSGVIREVNVL